MPDLKISQLPAASTPLAGTELVPVVQGGITEQTPVQSLLTSTVPSGTANGVMYLNGSKVATTGGALTFDGSNLGIGTSSPGAKLDVRGASGVQLQVFETSTGNDNRLRITQTAGITDYNLTYGVANTNAQTWSIGNIENMRLTSAGNLGIGTSSPSFSLDVNGLVGVGTKTASAGAGGNVRYRDDTGTFRWAAGILGSAGETAFGWYDAVTATERMRLDASGNLGIGTTPSGWSPGTFRTAIQIGYAGFAGAPGTEVTEVSSNQYVNSSGNRIYIATGVATLYQQNGGQHAFYTAPSGTAGNAASFTQAMTLDASGNLLVGTTTAGGTPTAGLSVNYNSGTTYLAVGHINGSSSGSAYASFAYNGTQIGSISQNGTTAVAYNTSSDYRLKNITGPITDSGSYIDSLNPVQGTWKSDGSTFVGLIAHEVQEVSRTKVATGEKDGAEMQGMDYSSAEIIANLIAEVKSLRARVAALESN